MAQILIELVQSSVQLVLCTGGFCILWFNQPWFENIRKRISRKFQNAKFEFFHMVTSIYIVLGIIGNLEMV